MINIIIINWNSGDYVKRCLRSIFGKDNISLIRRVYVIDNNSSDLSISDIPAYEKLEIIRNKSNVGFAKAVNQGFRASTAPYVLLLSPDTQLLNNTLNCLLTSSLSNDSRLPVLQEESCSLICNVVDKSPDHYRWHCYSGTSSFMG